MREAGRPAPANPAGPPRHGHRGPSPRGQAARESSRYVLEPRIVPPPGGPPGRRRPRPLAVAVLVCGLLVLALGVAGLVMLTGHPGAAGSRAAAGSVPAPSEPAAPAPDPSPAAAAPAPVSLTIPAISVNTRLIRLGITAQGTLQVPTSTAVAGWYTGSPRPGQIGSSVIAGHIDSHLGPGIFYRLSGLRPGERIYVRRANGSLAVFSVTAVRQYPKDRFPTSQVYGPAPDAELNLITCGGTFDYATRNYLSNVVVYSTEVR